MLVNNREPRFHAIGHHVVLNPGITNVPDDVWAECKKIELVRLHIKEGRFQEILGAKGKPVADITKMKVDEAIAVVKQTVDIPLLEDWRSNAKGQLAKAIDEQLELLEKKPE